MKSNRHLWAVLIRKKVKYDSDKLGMFTKVNTKINVHSTLLKVELCISIAIGIGYCGSIPHYALIINLIKMETIHSQIKSIKMQSKEFENVVNNYNMGLITMSEKHHQLTNILITIDKISKEIQKEYGINSTAVNLMLELY